MKHDAISTAESLIERLQAKIEAMLNNMELYEPHPDPWNRVQSLIAVRGAHEAAALILKAPKQPTGR